MLDSVHVSKPRSEAKPPLPRVNTSSLCGVNELHSRQFVDDISLRPAVRQPSTLWGREILHMMSMRDCGFPLIPEPSHGKVKNAIDGWAQRVTVSYRCCLVPVKSINNPHSLTATASKSDLNLSSSSSHILILSSNCTDTIVVLAVMFIT